MNAIFAHPPFVSPACTSSLLRRPRSSSTVTHLGLSHVRLLLLVALIYREISGVGVGSRGLSSLNWFRSSPPLAADVTCF